MFSIVSTSPLFPFMSSTFDLYMITNMEEPCVVYKFEHQEDLRERERERESNEYCKIENKINFGEIKLGKQFFWTYSILPIKILEDIFIK